MPDIPKPLQDLLAQLGISEESAQTFKFGGIVGKVALIALVGVLAATGIAKLTAGWVQAACVVAVLATILVVIRWVLDYAEKHPELATLEGTQVILWRQQQIMLAAKLLTPPIDGAVIPNPEGAPPQSNPAQGADQP